MILKNDATDPFSYGIPRLVRKIIEYFSCYKYEHIAAIIKICKLIDSNLRTATVNDDKYWDDELFVHGFWQPFGIHLIFVVNSFDFYCKSV